MGPIASTRRRRPATVVATVAFIVSSAAAGWTGEPMPCGAGVAAGAADSGWRVQVDPDTGTYSMPAPESFAAPTRTRAFADRDLVVVPGRSPAGGYMIRLGDGTDRSQEQH
jgi:hypothetical protein